MPELHIRVFWLPKAGNRPEEYEDAWDFDAQAGRLAIADGASDAFESRLWATALAQAFVHQPPPFDGDALLRWLAEPAQTWRSGIRWEELPWYAEEKARRGAFATLLGLTFAWLQADFVSEDGPVGEWRAIAVGDACLFQIRRDALISSFPMTDANAFGTTPLLLSTRPDYSQRSLEQLSVCEGKCQAGDLFLLATDALAAWFLHEVEAGEHPWHTLRDMGLPHFARLVDRLREEHTLRNDDVTLLLVRV